MRHKIKLRFNFLLLLFLIFCPLNANAQKSKIIDSKPIATDSQEVIISKINIDQNKKLAIYLTDNAEYKIYSLSKPERLLIEIKNGKLQNENYRPKIDPQSTQFISKITFENLANQSKTLVITLFFKEKHLAKNTSFDKKNNIILCELTPKIINPTPTINNLTNQAQIQAKTQDSSAVKDIKKVAYNENIATKKPELIINKTANSIAKYVVRKPINDSSTLNRDILPTTKLNNEANNKAKSDAVLGAKGVNKILLPPKKPIIVIDAGHGGKDPGAIGVFARTKEKNITLSYAKELAKNLMNEKKYKVFLTRDEDYFIPLDKRVEKSRRKKADLFISLHANSTSDNRTSGFSIYTLSETSSDKKAELLAQKENQADIINGVDFSNASKDITKTLIDLSQRESKNSSAKLAKNIIYEIRKANIEILQNTHRFAGFMVLTAPDMASVLIELGYLSNKEEEEMLNSASYRRLVAKTLTLAINQYFKNFKN